ncbi:MAG: acetyl ornithine aminotransferase family protein [Aggregatilineales bacterium]|nr:acetyl ornithine aminotransferase family protein [Chloroflexota bacterium]HPV05786.1 acetyl ornithine aminotransferase family protein [Aggregatilineales bacterium]HQE17551.1 acetyl ornithine aminotransferase family protein [Aggregatilineales bacterium]
MTDAVAPKPLNPDTPIPGPKGEAIIERDRRVLSPSLPRSYPLVIDHAQGAEVWDADGCRYIDFMTGIAVTSTGHCHPEVVAAIKEQAEKFLHICLADFHYDVAVTLAEKLAAIAPFEEEAQIFFTNSGAEAVESALKLARHHTGRQGLISFHGAFHGRTMGALSLTASKYRQKEGFAPFVPGVTHVPYPDTYRPVFAVPDGKDYGEVIVDYIEHTVFKSFMPGNEVAAIFVEPILGEGGYVVPPPGFFPALRDLCDRYGILLVADEVQSGIGRTGKWWAIEHFGVEPDIVTSAKGIASGMPLGAVIARKSIMTWGPGAHGNTFGGNPVSCAAALATLRLIENGYMQNAAEMGEYLLDALREMQTRHPLIGDLRGKGLMIGIEIVSDREKRTPAHDLRDQIVDEAFHNGLLLLGAGESVIRLMPPLMITREIADEALAIFDRVLTSVESNL